jgi:hypothetical protein
LYGRQSGKPPAAAANVPLLATTSENALDALPVYTTRCCPVEVDMRRRDSKRRRHERPGDLLAAANRTYDRAITVNVVANDRPPLAKKPILCMQLNQSLDFNYLQ